MKFIVLVNANGMEVYYHSPGMWVVEEEEAKRFESYAQAETVRHTLTTERYNQSWIRAAE